MNKSKLNYRPDIDGLRAVAVLSVVIFHAFPKSLPGGFTGVDIFFVISGYLISGIIYSSLDSGKFSFLEFYERRIRRIFPALILTLIMVTGAGYYYLLIDEFEELGKHVAASSVFIQNIVFLNESGYFDKASDLKPLLHLWSLAVEEQFYILFPPIILLIWRFKKHIHLIILIAIVVSFIANLWMSYTNIAETFFLTTYRCWELLAGSLLAFISYSKPAYYNRYMNLFSLSGIALIALGIAFLDKDDLYPSWRALLPVMGSVLLISGGQNAFINKRILANKAIVWIGLISYPLYLYHWPIFSYINILDCGEHEKYYKIVGLILSFSLAVITYYMVENKVRYSKSKLTTLILGILFIGLGVFGVLIWKKNIVPRSSGMGCDAYVDAYNDVKYFHGAGSKGSKYGSSSYIHESDTGLKKTLYIGDSHMQQCAPRILELYGTGKSGNRGYLFFTRGGLVPIPGISEKGVPYDEYIPKMLELSKRSDVDRIVVAANWLAYFIWTGHKHVIESKKLNENEGSDNAFASLELMLKQYINSGKDVYIVNNIPVSEKFHPKKLLFRSINGEITSLPPQISVEMFRSLRSIKNQAKYNQGEVLDKIAQIANEVGAKIIDPMSILIIDGQCKLIHEGLPIYRDGYHLRAGFVREHATYLDETMKP